MTRKEVVYFILGIIQLVIAILLLGPIVAYYLDMYFTYWKPESMKY